MADYYPVLKRAVDTLAQNTGEARRGVYERARTALVAQLKSFDPPLSAAEITEQRLALEESIRKVEAEAAGVNLGRLRPSTRPAAAPVAPPPPPPVAPVAEPDPFIAAAPEPVEDIAPVAAPAAAPPAPRRLSRRERRAAEAAAAAAAKASAAAEQSPADDFGADEPEPAPTPPPPPSRRSPPPRVAYTVERRSRAPAIVAFALLLVIVGGLAVVGWLNRGLIEDIVRDFTGEPAEEATDQVALADESLEPKDEDRLETADAAAGTEIAAAAPAGAPAAVPTIGQLAGDAGGLQVAQSAVLSQVAANGGAPVNAAGQVLWSAGEGSPSIGLAVRPQVLATADVPGEGLRVDMVIRENGDVNLPASHVIELRFTLGESFDGDGIAEVTGVFVRPSENEAAVALEADAAMREPGYFWVVLDGRSPETIDGNLALLTEGQWLEIRVRYTNGAQAILALEKGTPGEAAVDSAVAAWAAG